MKKFILSMLILGAIAAFPGATAEAAKKKSITPNIIEMTTDNVTDLMNDPRPLVIKVYADWCGPCVKLNPIYDEVVATYNNQYTFTKLDVDQQHELAKNFNVKGIPTVLFYKDGNEVGRSVGYVNKKEFVKRMEAAFEG